jgi:hypothetical protein
MNEKSGLIFSSKDRKERKEVINGSGLRESKNENKPRR